MAFFGCCRASSRAARLRQLRRAGFGVLLGASLAACFDSKRIVFGAAGAPDAGGSGAAAPAPEARATAATPPAVVGSERAADPTMILEATPLAADESVPLDAGVATGVVDAGAIDASPPMEPAAP